MRVVQHIKKNLNMRKSTGMLSIDLQAAFDSIWHEALLHKMMVLEFPVYLVKIVQSFLTNRLYRVRVGNALSEPRPIVKGVPQGAVLSPTLFNIFVADIPQMSDTEMASFADDNATLANSHRTSTVVNRLDKCGAKLSRYFNDWQIRLNPTKSETCLFSRKRASRHQPTRGVTLEGIETEWKDSVKYLGLHLDRKLTYKVHIDYIVSRTEKMIRALYPLISRNSKLSTDNKLLIYKTMLRPSITYASPVWSSCALTHRLRLQRLQSKTLKMMLGLHWRTSTDYVHAVSGVESLNDYLSKLNLKFWSRCELSLDNEVLRLCTASRQPE